MIAAGAGAWAKVTMGDVVARFLVDDSESQ